MIEFDTIATADHEQFRVWLNAHVGQGWTPVSVCIALSSNRPFVAIVQRENAAPIPLMPGSERPN